MSGNIQLQNIKNTPGFKYTIAKYVIILAIAGFVAFIIQSGKQANIPFEEMRAAVEQKIDQESMHDAGRKGFRRYYGLSEGDFDGVLFYQSVSGMSAEEILLVKVKDQKQIEELREVIETRRESRIHDFESYAPDEAQLMEHAELIEKGDYVIFLPTPQALELKQAFEDALHA